MAIQLNGRDVPGRAFALAAGQTEAGSAAIFAVDLVGNRLRVQRFGRLPLTGAAEGAGQRVGDQGVGECGGECGGQGVGAPAPTVARKLVRNRAPAAATQTSTGRPRGSIRV